MFTAIIVFLLAVLLGVMIRAGVKRGKKQDAQARWVTIDEMMGPSEL